MKHITPLPGAQVDQPNPALAEHAEAIRHLGKRVISDVIEIGRRLVECKKIVGHGGWLPWLDREFGWTEQTALNFIRIYEAGKSESKKFLDLDLPISGLYLLFAPSTPPEAQAEITERVETGEKVTVEVVKEVIDKHPKPKGWTRERYRRHRGKKTHKSASQAEINSAEVVSKSEVSDIGPASRLTARVEELEHEVRRRESEIIDLKSQIKDLQAPITVKAACEIIDANFDTFIAAMSPALRKRLEARVRAERDNGGDLNCNATLTRMLQTAMEHAVIAENPKTGREVAESHRVAGLKDLRDADRKLRAMGYAGHHDLAAGPSANARPKKATVANAAKTAIVPPPDDGIPDFLRRAPEAQAADNSPTTADSTTPTKH
jgi:hypothetical protein